MFDKWITSKKSLNKCFFIVDKDFDHFRNNTVPNHANLIELEKYTIENYLITKEGAISLLKTKIFDKDKDELEALLDWENWINLMYHGFKDLFIAYAIAFKFDLGPNTGIKPGKYFEKKTYLVDKNMTEKYILDIKKLCAENDIEYEREAEIINQYYKKDTYYDYDGLIKGKYLSFGLLKYLNFKILSVKLDEDLCYPIMVKNISLEPFEFLKNKLIGSISLNLIS
ncbi:DUF4435 domain-containing protein [Bacillus stercoris]|nr:DUF4435 domain-containing protein [Bacillus stercoris]WIL36165.1 DUF4435 domain-containing protein [Bacillus stercoris]